MKDKRRIILALGTNAGSGHMSRGQQLLGDLLADVRYSRVLTTEPIGMVSPPFLNCLAEATTRLSKTDLRRKLKWAERCCGDSKKRRRRNVITMDIDLLLYDRERLHPADWERHYVGQLMKEMGAATEETTTKEQQNLGKT